MPATHPVTLPAWWRLAVVSEGACKLRNRARRRSRSGCSPLSCFPLPSVPWPSKALAYKSVTRILTYLRGEECGV